MSLYALDRDDLLSAADAESGKAYRCPECLNSMKRRRGKRGLFHFYHLQKPIKPCRLYTKTEDHLFVQIELQSLFPKGDLELERSFPQIGRIGDLCWEKRKIVFEIQCSFLSEKEASDRILDYRSIGYEPIWLLDDRRYNRKTVGAAEKFLRGHSCYYFSIGSKGKTTFCYDQFEIFSNRQRIRKGRKMGVDLQKIEPIPKGPLQKQLEKQSTPQQIGIDGIYYFHRDRIYWAFSPDPIDMLLWRTLELEAAGKETEKGASLISFFRRLYLIFFEKMIGWFFSKNWGG